MGHRRSSHGPHELPLGPTLSPTPVSALIHAATMVTAGVFLIIRSSPLFIVAEDILVLMTIMGSLTALFAATSGLLQNDLKRVIAYSTCSQLGYMVFACGIASFATSFFHLANHAFFKALLFLSAGAVIHALGDEQDMRKMGGLIRLLPFTYVMILIGSLSLMGFPFLTGYYSKDVILESTFAYSFVSFDSSFAYWLGTISAFFTAFYSIRLIYLTFITDTNAYHSILKNVHEVPIKMAIPLMILAFGSIFIGFLTKDLIIGFGTPFWNNAIVLLPNDAEFLPFFIKLIPVIFSLLGAIIGYSLYSSNLLWNWASPEQGTAVARFVYSFFNQKWYFDQIYNRFCVQPLLKIGYHTTFKLLDKGIIEILGPYGIASIIRFTVDRARNIQSGLIYHYTFIMVSGLILLLLAASQKDAIIASFPLNDLLLIVLIGIIIVQINTTTSRL
jgi:NADH-ubiquinone oxidoreductase chain 5